MSNQEDKNAAGTPAGDDKNNPESASDASQIDSSVDNKSNVVEIAPLEDLKKLFSKVKDNMLRSSTAVDGIIEAQNLVSILSA